MVLTIDKSILDKIVSKKDFGNDIVIGELGETLFKQYLIKHKGLTFVRKSEDKKDLKKWDLEFLHKGRLVRYEIKTDVFIQAGVKDTGNIFVEFHSRGIDSGISSTSADVWVNIFFHLNEMWVIMVDSLKKIISENNFKVTKDSGDTNSNTRGYLIPREKYREYFKVIKYDLIS